MEDAQNNVNHAQDNVNDAKSNVNQAQNDVNQADDAVSKAQDNVNDAQADLDKGNHAQADLDQAQDDLNHAQDNASKAQVGANQADQAQNDAAQKANDAKQHADDAAKAQNDAQHKADAANKAQDDAQKALDDAKSHQANPNQVHLSQEYIDALNDYARANPEDDDYQQILDRLAAATKKEWELNGGYVSDAHDKTIKINSQADLDKYINELNQYAQELINNIRDQFGTENVQISKGSEDLGQAIGDAYTNNNWDGGTDGHDFDTNADIAHQHGLTQLSEQDIAMAMSKVLSNSWGLTLDDFKRGLYDAIQTLLFNGTEWDHAYSIAGNGLSAIGNDVWMGISWDIADASNAVIDGQTNISAIFNFVYGYTIDDTSKFDTTPIKSDVPSQSTIDQLENDLKTKQADANAANQALATAKANHAKAQAALNAANTALNAAKANQAKAHANLTQAQAAVKDAKAAVVAAQHALDEANANHAAKQKALDDAKAKLADAKANQAQKHAVLNDANAKLAKANKGLADAQAKLAAAQAVLAAGQQALADKEAKLADLKNADKALADAKAAVKAAQKAYDDANTAANQAQIEADGDQVVYEHLQALADKAAKALADAKARLAQLEHQRNINDAIDGVDNGSKGSDKNYDENINHNGSNASNESNSSNTSNTWDDPTVLNNSAMSNGSSEIVTPAMVAARAMSNRSRSQVVKASILPQTGETNNNEGSMIGLALLSLLGTFGLAKTSRRRKY